MNNIVGYSLVELIKDDEACFTWSYLFSTPREAMVEIEFYLYEIFHDETNDGFNWAVDSWTCWRSPLGRVIHEFDFVSAYRLYTISSIHIK